ncbi:hypothetical protein [Dactylosporangium sp. CA-139066]|uniref:hypothetical protein n=1 Tax=Dactylosporangium sp. CA-139066 TaxID=3239930 RepID=UPI003D8D5C31
MADNGISAGSVYVDIVPRADRFWPEFVAKNQAGAEKTGQEIGKVIGRAIAVEVAKGVRDGLDRAGAGVRAQGGRYGQEFGGTFADTARRRIEAALRSLPTPQIGVATTEAEQKLKDLRGELSTLASKRIGVDIGATEALEEVRRLKAALDELAAKSPNAQVRVDTGQASLELAAIDRELARLDGRRASAKVDVDTGNSRGEMNALVAAGLALGPAIVPGAAAGAAAIVGLGIGAASAVPAVGVLALAFHGVGDAVKALDAAQSASAKTGATLLGQQRSLASSADQLRSAEAGLANSRATAADAQRRSLQQIADAERSLVRVQEDAQRAQQALNDAREEEKRSQEDTALRLRQNAIDQRRAAAEVEAATAAVKTKSTQQTRDALEEALLRQEELAVQGRRLTEEQARNQQTGVDGSRRVQAAQDAVARSQERIAEGERAVTEARQQAAAQARQSAYAIQQAQQAVVAAQRAAGAATVASAATAGSAVDKLDDAMGNLPATGQRFARFLFGLKPELLDLQTAASDGLLPGVQEGIQILLPHLADVRGFIGGVSTEMGTLARRGAETFTNPFWRQFFSYVGSQAVPTMDGLFTATVNVAEGGARIIQQFAPFERQVGGGLVNVTRRFAEFSQGLDHNQGFQEFIRYAQTEGPRVVQTVGAIATAGSHIAQAYAPIGSVVVTELRILAEVIDAIPVPVVSALATALTAYKLAALLGGGAQAVLNSSLLQGTGRMLGFQAATASAATGVTGFQSAAKATSSFMGGPFGLGIGLAVTAIGYLITAHQQAKAEIDQNARSLSDVGDEYKRTGKVSAESIASMVRQNPQLRDLTAVLRQQGLTVDDLGRSYQNNLELQKRVLDAAKAQADADAEAHKRAFQGSFGFGGGAELDKAKRSRELYESLKKSYEDAKFYADAYSDAANNSADRTNRVAIVFRDASPSVKSLADSFRIVADTASTAAQKTDALRAAEDSLFGAARQADEAAEDQAKAIIAANKTLDDRNLLNEKGAKKLDMTTEAGLRVRDSLKDELIAINNTYRANIANGMSVDAATKAHDAEVESLKKKWEAKGLDRDATQKLIDIYGKVPTSATTDIAVTGLDATKAQLDELLTYQYALRNGITFSQAQGQLHPETHSPGGRGQSRGSLLAEGGPVIGPGSGTSDDVPAMERSTGAPFWLSNGEFVHKTAAVNYYGPAFMHAVNDMKIPKQAVRGYASGGLIQQLLTDHYPYPTTTAMTRIPTRAEVARAVTEGPSSGGREDIKAFIRAVDRLPYIWAAAGPFGYDCSGLASAVFGLVTGRGGGHGQRYFTTYDFANGAPAGTGLKPGAGGVLTLGVNPQSHMAGNYGGLGFEAASTRSGIKIGTSARKPSTFQKQFHLASGGLVSAALLDELGLDIGGDPSGITVDGRRIPLGAYDVGGYLPQGLSLAYNGTGRPEPVIPAERLERAATGRAPVVQNFYPAADLDERAVATMAARRLALAAVS